MDYDKEALDLISRSENIAAAIEITRLVDQLKPHFQKSFWLALSAKVESLMQASDLAASWQLVASEHYDVTYAGLVIKPKQVTPNQRFIRVKLEQGRKQVEYPLYYGFIWDREFPDWQKIPELNPIQKELRNEGFVECNSWWMGYKYLGISVWGQPFLLRMGTDREALITEMAECLLELLQTQKHKIDTVQAVLKQVP